jgi:hypothetical protein
LVHSTWISYKKNTSLQNFGLFSKILFRSEVVAPVTAIDLRNLLPHSRSRRDQPPSQV